MNTLPVPQPSDDSRPPPSPFRGTQSPPARTWLERLLRRPTPGRAEQALAALFGTTSPHAVGESQVAAILTEHRAFGEHARDVGQSVLRRALEAFLQDHAITVAELAYLERLCRLLDIGFDDIERITQELTRPIYERALAEAAADKVVTEDERKFLGQLVDNLRLPPETAKQMASPVLGGVVQNRFNEMIADRRFSPAEFAELEALARNMGITLTMDDATQTQLRRFALLWRVEQGDIPAIEAPIALQNGELCHFACPATWHEYRTRTQRLTYHGPVVSIPIVRGLRYRIGSFAPSAMRVEELTRIDEGTVYLTSKRVLFDGDRRNTAIRLSALIGLQVFRNGLALEKGTGRSPHLELAGDTELAATILSTLLAQPAR